MQKYDVVCTNPPYLGSGRFNSVLSEFVNSRYKDEKSDLSMVMFRHCVDHLAKNNGFVSFITTSSWFFLSSFEKLRKYIISSYQFDSIVDYGTELFDGKVGHNPIVSWSLCKHKPYKDIQAIRLVDYCYSRRDEKEPEFFNQRNHYTAKQENFAKIPGMPVAYWVSEAFVKAFQNKKVFELGQTSKGVITGDNGRFLRQWWEVITDNIKFDCTSSKDCIDSNMKWFPCCKGGDFRKWFGNMNTIIDWQSNGYRILNNTDSGHHSQDYYDWMKFKPILNWSSISSSKASFRYSTNCISEHAGMAYAAKNSSELLYFLGLLNSVVVDRVLQVVSPTLNYNAGEIGKIPVAIDDENKDVVDELVNDSVFHSKIDWNSFETSWGFKKHPLV